jgi:hypothetical protein
VTAIERPDAATLDAPTPYRQALTVESAKRLRGNHYTRPTRGVVVRAPALPRDRDHGSAIGVFRAALGEDAVLGGPSAAWALGARLARPTDPVEVVLPASRRVRPRPGLRVRGDALADAEIVATPFGLATSPARSVFDLARRGRPEDALAWADAVLRATGTAADDVQRLTAAHPRLRGVRQARSIVAVADPRAESPRESMLRWLLLDAGLPPPTPQLVVRGPAGVFVARLDLGWEAARVGVEYDGGHHRERSQHSRDLVRHNRLRALGWDVVQIDADQFRHPDRVVALLRTLLGPFAG